MRLLVDFLDELLRYFQDLSTPSRKQAYDTVLYYRHIVSNVLLDIAVVSAAKKFIDIYETHETRPHELMAEKLLPHILFPSKAKQVWDCMADDARETSFRWLDVLANYLNGKKDRCSSSEEGNSSE